MLSADGELARQQMRSRGLPAWLRIELFGDHFDPPVEAGRALAGYETCLCIGERGAGRPAIPALRHEQLVCLSRMFFRVNRISRGQGGVRGLMEQLGSFV